MERRFLFQPIEIFADEDLEGSALFEKFGQHLVFGRQQHSFAQVLDRGISEAALRLTSGQFHDRSLGQQRFARPCRSGQNRNRP